VNHTGLHLITVVNVNLYKYISYKWIQLNFLESIRAHP